MLNKFIKWMDSETGLIVTFICWCLILPSNLFYFLNGIGNKWVDVFFIACAVYYIPTTFIKLRKVWKDRREKSEMIERGTDD